MKNHAEGLTFGIHCLTLNSDNENLEFVVIWVDSEVYTYEGHGRGLGTYEPRPRGTL